jgi:hypothetical protein
MRAARRGVSSAGFSGSGARSTCALGTARTGTGAAEAAERPRPFRVLMKGESGRRAAISTGSAGTRGSLLGFRRRLRPPPDLWRCPSMDYSEPRRRSHLIRAPTLVARTRAVCRAPRSAFAYHSAPPPAPKSGSAWPKIPRATGASTPMTQWADLDRRENRCCRRPRQQPDGTRRLAHAGTHPRRGIDAFSSSWVPSDAKSL